MAKVLNKYHHGNAVPPNAVNIMRPSIYGNPFAITPDQTRDQVVDRFDAYATARIETDMVFRQAVLELDGRDVCCCCTPRRCHGDVLLRLSQELAAERDEGIVRLI